MCHSLLGRPWQFDRKVSHEGDTDVYNITSQSKKIRLHPLPPKVASKPTDGATMVSLVRGEDTMKGMNCKQHKRE